MNGKFRFQNIGSGDIELQGTIDKTEVGGIDLEIYAGQGFTLGMNARFEYSESAVRLTKVKTVKGELHPNEFPFTSYVFRTTIGGFIRGQYLVTSHLGLFTKGDVGVGPYITGLAGVTFDGIVQVGIDYYFSDWWGVTASYGYIANYGVETVASKRKDIKEYLGEKPLFFSANGNLLLIGLKSTYL